MVLVMVRANIHKADSAVSFRLISAWPANRLLLVRSLTRSVGRLSFGAISFVRRAVSANALAIPRNHLACTHSDAAVSLSLLLSVYQLTMPRC